MKFNDSVDTLFKVTDVNVKKFNDYYKELPIDYVKPDNWLPLGVPSILLSKNASKISTW